MCVFEASRDIMPCGYSSSSYILLLSLRLRIELRALSFFERQRFEPFSKWILIYYIVKNNIVFNKPFYRQDTDGAAARLEKMTRVKQVVDDGKGFMFMSQWMDTEINFSV